MQTKIKDRKGIRFKIALISFLATSAIAFAGIGLGYFWGFNLIRDIIVKEHREIAYRLSRTISEMIDEEIEDISTYSSSIFWRDFIVQKNLTYKDKPDQKGIQDYLLEMDEKWSEAAADSSLIKEYLENPLSLQLNQITKTSPEVAEIFITDKYGGLVAASGKTSDFYQADEEWWQKAYQGSVFTGKIELDKSSNAWGIPVAMPIKNKNGEIIGVCKAVIKTDIFFSPLKRVKIGNTGQASLADVEGYLIFHKDLSPLRERVSDIDVWQKALRSNNNWFILDDKQTAGRNREDMLLSFAKIDNEFLKKNGIDLVVLIEQEVPEVFRVLRKYVLQAVVLASLLVLVLSFLSFLFSNYFTRPIRKLQEATERIGAGDLDYKITIKTNDEIEQLADALNQMSDNLKQTTTSVTALNKEIEYRKNTEQRLLEIAGKLEKSNRELRKLDELKSEFVSTVSHELRTPLSITREGISLVLDGITGSINKQQEEMLNTARDNIDRLARIINNLLDISKIESGKIQLKREETDIVTLAEQTVKLFEAKAKEKGLDIKTNFPEQKVYIYADADRIHQVFTNLISNAIKFTEKGYIEISIKEIENEIECTVSDTGVGISETDLKNVFDKFRQFARVVGPGEKGTGLGLSIAKGIIEIHKGRIWVESQLGKGTKFTFILSKYTHEALFKECVSRGIDEAIRNNTKVSLVVITIANFEVLKQKMPPEDIYSILKEIKDELVQSLRRQGDTVVKDTGEVIVLLPDCNKEIALRVEGRLEQVLDEYLASQNLTGTVKLHFGSATYPDEAANEDELINRAKSV